MKFNVAWLKKYTDLPEDNWELNQVIDRIATQIVDVDERNLDGNKTWFDVDNKIITNRPYCFGHRGMAREIAVMLNQDWRGGDFPNIDLGLQTPILPVTVEVKDPDLCPRFTAISIKGVKIGPSPEWLVQELEAVGQRSINNLVDITNYIMLDTSQPVHAYDYHKIINAGIIVRRAIDGEKAVTLDGVDRTLDSEMVLITDAEKVIGIGGVMGCGNSEIDENTTDIILEVASFHPINIRQTARKLRHRTDAVTRFEKGPDIMNIENVQRALVGLVLELCGGEVASNLIDIKNLEFSKNRTESLKIEFDPSRVDRLLGFGVEGDFIDKVFDGFGIKKNEVITKHDEVGVAKEIWKVEIPTYRSDLKESADLIEDIGRMYGYQNIPKVVPVNGLVLPERNRKVTVLNKIRKALTSSGLDEVITYPFISEKDVNALKSVNLLGSYLLGRKIDEPLALVNSLSEDYKFLRPTLIGSMAKVIGLNLKYFDKFGIFEISRRFLPSVQEKKSYTEDHGESQRPEEVQVVTLGFYSKKEKENAVFELKGAIENLFAELRVSDYEINQNGEISINGKNVGRILILDRRFGDNYDIETPSIYAEILLDELIENYVDTVHFRQFSKFQGSRLDYSVFVPLNTPVASVEAAIPGNALIVEKKVSDVYRNQKEGLNKKSILVSIKLQKSDANITSEEVYEVGIQIENALRQIEGLEIRGGGIQKSVKNEKLRNENNGEVPGESELISLPEELATLPIENELLEEKISDELVVEKHEDLANLQNEFIVVGRILELTKHPNADKLVICKVYVGKAKPEGTLFPDYLQIITGADNIKPGIAENKIVPVALPGATVKSHKTGEIINIGIGNLRGEVSEGMLCSADELDLPNPGYDGILILDSEKYAKNIGEVFNY